MRIHSADMSEFGKNFQENSRKKEDSAESKNFFFYTGFFYLASQSEQTRRPLSNGVKIGPTLVLF